jgi:hypothetical protein
MNFQEFLNGSKFLSKSQTEELFKEKFKRSIATYYRWLKDSTKNNVECIDVKEQKIKVEKIRFKFKFNGEVCYFCLAESKIFHHIDMNRKNNNTENLIPLCVSCHLKLHQIYLKLLKFKDKKPQCHSDTFFKNGMHFK